MRLDLATIDLDKLQASQEFDALIAREWMGWVLKASKGCKKQWNLGYKNDKGNQQYRKAAFWSPSIDPAHAGEARRKAKWFSVEASPLDGKPLGITCWINRQYSGFCWYDDTNGDKGKTEALATCRAIAASISATQGK